MVLTGIAIFLSLMGIAVFPCWRYSARWGYAPSAAIGVMLLLVSILGIGGKANTSDAYVIRLTSAAGPDIAQMPAGNEDLKRQPE